VWFYNKFKLLAQTATLGNFSYLHKSKLVGIGQLSFCMCGLHV